MGGRRPGGRFGGGGGGLPSVLPSGRARVVRLTAAAIRTVSESADQRAATQLSY